MEFIENLREFLGQTVGEAEARVIAGAVVAANIRGLKPAIAERVWQARQRSAAGDQDGAAGELAEARRLKARYDNALDEYRRLKADGPAGRS